jgi:hypothetical protein
MAGRGRVLGLSALLGITPLPASGEAQDWLAFRSSLRHEWLTGNIGAPSGPMRGNARSDWSVILRPPPIGGFRVSGGSGISRVTYDLDASRRSAQFP